MKIGGWVRLGDELLLEEEVLTLSCVVVRIGDALKETRKFED